MLKKDLELVNEKMRKELAELNLEKKQSLTKLEVFSNREELLKEKLLQKETKLKNIILLTEAFLNITCEVEDRDMAHDYSFSPQPIRKIETIEQKLLMEIISLASMS